MSWQNDARSRSANAVFHKHKDLIAQTSEGGAAADPNASSYMLQQPAHIPVHMPPVPLAHMAGHMALAMPPQMMPMAMYPAGPMLMQPPQGFEGDAAQKNALPMRVDGCFNLEPILYQNIMDSDYFRSLAKLVSYFPYSASISACHCCDMLYRFHDIVEELEKTVEHCEPHLAGQVYCCLQS